MENVLNLALKKEIFEGLLEKTNNEIPIEKSNWWKKRLMDLDTGRFKSFDTVKASCGSSDKYDFHIEKIEERGNQYIVTVSFDNELLKPTGVNPVKITDMGEIVQENTKTVEEIQKEINEKLLAELNTEKKEYTAPKTTITEVEDIIVDPIYINDNKDDNWLNRIKQLFNNFASYENVYIVSTPTVQIRCNGQVVSSGRRIFMKRDYDMNFPFEDKTFVKKADVNGNDFYNDFYEGLKKLLQGNLIFCKRGSLRHETDGNGNDIFSVKMAVKKSYMFR